MAHTLDRLDPSEQDFSLGWTTGSVVGNRMEWWPQTATFEGDVLAHLPIAREAQGWEDDAEYLGNVRGTCGHYAEDAHSCVHCGVVDCCDVYEGCSTYDNGEYVCHDCVKPCRCPECEGV